MRQRAGEVQTAKGTPISQDELRSALEAFEPVWESLRPVERQEFSVRS
jgi:hypothetical protein